MTFLTVKALHIIFVITWFAGLFYIVRLFIYKAESDLIENELEKNILLKQFSIMQRRLWYGITWPSAILTFIFGFWLIYLYGSMPLWLIFKLGLVFLLYVYHFSCQKIYTQQKNNIYKYSAYNLRIWNEVATLFLFAIVFVVVLKQEIGLKTIIIGLSFLALLLFFAIKIYAAKRQKEEIK